MQAAWVTTGLLSGLPLAATRDGHRYDIAAGDTLRVELEPGAYLVRALRVGSDGDFGALIRLTERSETNPFAGGILDVRDQYIVFPLGAQVWTAADRQCACWIVAIGGDEPFDLQVLIWRYGDCPPEFGGIPTNESQLLPKYR
jgi:hypothetical protein